MTLLPGEAKLADGIVMTQREWAADILHEVEFRTRVGMFPQDVSAFDLGRALGRALTNCNEEDPVKELDRGLDHYYSNKRGI